MLPLPNLVDLEGGGGFTNQLAPLEGLSQWRAGPVRVRTVRQILCKQPQPSQMPSGQGKKRASFLAGRLLKGTLPRKKKSKVDLATTAVAGLLGPLGSHSLGAFLVAAAAAACEAPERGVAGEGKEGREPK